MRQGPVGVLEVWDHAFPRIDFSGLNLLSRARFLLAPMIPSAATGLYTFNTAGFLGLLNALRQSSEFARSLISGVHGFFADTYVKANSTSVSSPSRSFCLSAVS